MDANQALKELRKLTSKMDHLFGSVVNQLDKLQPPLLKLRATRDFGSQNDQIKNKANIIADQVDQLKQLIIDQVESLQILTKAPPSRATAMLDFMYGIFVDPKAQTSRQEYMEKLRSVDKAFRSKEQEDIKLVSKRYLTPVAKFMATQIRQRSSTNTGVETLSAETLVNSISKLLGTAVVYKQVNKVELEEISNKLKKIQLDTVEEDSFWNKMFANLKQIFYKNEEEIARLEEAENLITQTFAELRRQDAENQKNQIKTSQAPQKPQYSTAFNNFLLLTTSTYLPEITNIVNKLHLIMQDISEKQSSDQSTILTKYFNFISKILDQSSELAIPHKLGRLKKEIQELRELIDKSTIQISTTSPKKQKVDPQMSDNTQSKSTGGSPNIGPGSTID